MREAGLEVLVMVSDTGSVQEVIYVEGLGIYWASVREAVSQWTFEPARYNGQPMGFAFEQTFVFRLE